MSTYYPDGEYYEVHYILEEGGDVEFVSEYRGRPMRSMASAQRCLEAEKKKHPDAIAWDVALYDRSGRID